MKVQKVNGDVVDISEIPWWRKDRRGWPIVICKNSPIQNALRYIIQNVKKLIPIAKSRRHVEGRGSYQRNANKRSDRPIP